MFSGKIDGKNHFLALQLVTPQVATSTVTGTGQDLETPPTMGAFAELAVGTVSGTTPTLDVKLQESDTVGGTYTDIPGAAFAQVTASTKQALLNVNNRSKRWVRALCTIAGTTPSFAFSVSLFGLRKSL